MKLHRDLTQKSAWHLAKNPGSVKRYKFGRSRRLHGRYDRPNIATLPLVHGLGFDHAIPASSRGVVDRTIEAKVYTDTMACQEIEAVKHSQFRTGCSTNGIESFWAMLKRGGTYHQIEEKHDRYINSQATTIDP